jgi:hypothetical protein
LRWNSPSINLGNPDTTGLNLPLLDLSGNLRIFEDTIDMGPYEFNRPSYNPVNYDERNFHLYPNPSSGLMLLECRSEKKFENLVVRIYNVKGGIVLEEFIAYGKTTFPINISDQATGIYFLTVSSNSSVLYRQKIVKE